MSQSRLSLNNGDRWLLPVGVEETLPADELHPRMAVTLPVPGELLNQAATGN